MGNVINFNNSTEVTNNKNEIEACHDAIEDITEEILLDLKKDLKNEKTIRMPITELALLGAGVSSLIPALRTVTQTTSLNTEGLYQLANASVGDTLKVAKNGNFWGAFKTAEGSSKFAQLQSAGPISTTNTTLMPIDPATIMMAVALFSIEMQLKNIEEMQKKIFEFLEIEKESDIEADMETLLKLISTYKYNWDNEHFISSNYKLALDIQRNSRKNMISYKKAVATILDSKKTIIAKANTKSTLNELQKKFSYYRLSLYNFSMASLIEIMLGGNFKEEYISNVKSEIKDYSMEYRELFTKCSLYLEKITSATIESNLMKGIGAASKVVGKFIGNIPVVKEGQIDEFLQDNGEHLKENAEDMQKNMVETFATLNNPGTSMFMEKMEDLINIYNHTDKICFDEHEIYLIAK